MFLFSHARDPKHESPSILMLVALFIHAQEGLKRLGLIVMINIHFTLLMGQNVSICQTKEPTTGYTHCLEDWS